MNPRGYINMAFVLQRFSNLPGWSFFASVVMILMRIPASPADGETLPNLMAKKRCYMTCLGWLNISIYIYTSNLVGGLEHEFYFPECMGCHPSHWRTPSFFKMVESPPTIYNYIYLYIYSMDWFKGIFYRKTPYESWENRWFPVKIFRTSRSAISIVAGH